MLFSSVLGVLLVHTAFAAYYPAEDYYMSSRAAVAQPRTYELPRNYFSDFNVESFNPFNWGKKRHEKSEHDVKIEGLFTILECMNKKEKDCNEVLEEVRLQIFGNRVKKTTTVSPSKSTTPVTKLSTDASTSNVLDTSQ